MKNFITQKLERLLVSKFPDFAGHIPRLLHEDEDFREIAEDYMLCKKALEDMDTPAKKTDLRKEYMEILQDLEEELNMHLTAIKMKKHTSRKAKPS